MEPVELVDCPNPSCRLPAEVLTRYNLRSTDGPVEHVQLRCMAGCCYLLPTEQLTR